MLDLIPSLQFPKRVENFLSFYSRKPRTHHVRSWLKNMSANPSFPLTELTCLAGVIMSFPICQLSPLSVPAGHSFLSPTCPASAALFVRAQLKRQLLHSLYKSPGDFLLPDRGFPSMLYTCPYSTYDPSLELVIHMSVFSPPVRSLTMGSMAH